MPPFAASGSTAPGSFCRSCNQARVAWGKTYTDHMRAIRNIDEGYAWIDANADALANCGRDAPKISDRIKAITKQAMDALESQTPANGKAAA